MNINVNNINFCSASRSSYLYLALITLLCFSGCMSQIKDSEKLESGFQKIPTALNDRDRLIEKMIPNKKYQYWQYSYFQPYTDGEKVKIIKSEGDQSFMKSDSLAIPKYGFFQECMPLGGCFSFITYIDEGKVRYILSENELVQFIGNINNLEEALLISKIHELWVNTGDSRGGSYMQTNSGYELFLTKYYDCPVKYESVKVKLDSAGKFSSKNLGTYFESTDCIMI